MVAAIKKACIRNYSIDLVELGGRKYLFSYFEYAGDDAGKDFAELAETPVVRDRWWPITKACHQRLPGTGGGAALDAARAAHVYRLARLGIEEF